jgi:UDP-GlcNAc:undecaprenyl-phosphate/decaprenyl-phosphate GlcNAc-1-phosphate transferase
VVLLTFFASLVSWVTCLLLIRYAFTHAENYGNTAPQRFHSGAVPRVGGLGIATGWVSSLGLFGVFMGLASVADIHLTPPFVATLTCVLFPSVGAGVMEDFTQRLSPLTRLMLTSVSAIAAITFLDLRIPRLDIPLLDQAISSWTPFWWLLTFAAIAGMPHAFNIIDGYNGLAGTVASLVCLAIAHVALQVGDRQLAALMLTLAGATAGFLLWNYPRGLIFAGDGGAYLWGGVVAIGSILLVQRHQEVSPWFPMLLLIYPVWETIFSIYRKLARGVSPGVADALHFHQLIYRRIVREVFHDDSARRMLIRNNRTSPYLWGFTLLTVIPAVLFWRNTWALIGFCVLFILTYVPAYLMIVRFKVPTWLRRRRLKRHH